MTRCPVSKSGLGSRLGTLFTLALALSIRGHAAAGGNLPWEAPMTAIATSLTGPVAYAIGLIGYRHRRRGNALGR